MSLFSKYKIVCDGDLTVFEGKQARFHVSKGGLEKCVLMHDTAKAPKLLEKTFLKTFFTAKDAVHLRSIMLFSGEGEIALSATARGFSDAIDWLRANGWQIDEALAQSVGSPGVRTFVRKK
ncbi:hypothetical protein Q1W73_14780 [Asticcacaulis sp. ZE23SCel15]|uniref:hypothetical protein n=1 Tax=Asticcacaulis sp. ZE23SCel15 TaxID=3059027 RepID=UPI00265FD8B4|nr:hypothetical protein [Asticcacaulis sp. ZE23SCel15]WKL56916.1 hypothetical protein Q1W73_14780 [Asticcacaulis sp. ZE23SCel15]